jgi:membrane protein YqaA with SNARE-associated domain
MLRRLYDRLMVLAASRHAPFWLAVVSFVESSVFPAPPDLMLGPMVLAKPEHAWRNAAICTAASVAGGILGYAIGYFLQPVGMALLSLMGHAGGLATFQAWFAQWGLWVILIKGLTPIPYKLVTIASGLAEFNFGIFVVASVVTRGARFFMVAGLLKMFGPPIQAFVEKRGGAGEGARPLKAGARKAKACRGLPPGRALHS